MKAVVFYGVGDIWMMRSGELDPAEILTQRELHSSAIDAYKAFDESRPGWIKVKLEHAVSHRTRRDTMVREILRNEVQRWVADAEAQLAEVLPAREYEEEHLPGAIHLPLTKLTRETAAKLRRDRPVIVYCYDARWDLSPRAAWRLESLGFTQVFDYVAGKVDWQASGLPTEGKRAGVPRVGERVRRDVSTCRLTDRLGEVAKHVRAAGWDGCVVVNEQRVVLGLLQGQALDGDPQQLVEEVMEPGPSTFRPDVTFEEMTAYMQQRQLDSVLITTADGKLVGILQRTAAKWRHGPELHHRRYASLGSVFDDRGGAFQEAIGRQAAQAEQAYEEVVQEYMRDTSCNRPEAVQVMEGPTLARLQDRQERVISWVESILASRWVIAQGNLYWRDQDFLIMKEN